MWVISYTHKLIYRYIYIYSNISSKSYHIIKDEIYLLRDIPYMHKLAQLCRYQYRFKVISHHRGLNTYDRMKQLYPLVLLSTSFQQCVMCQALKQHNPIEASHFTNQSVYLDLILHIPVIY